MDDRIVIIDCPPSLGPLTMNALNAATGVIIPIQCEYYAMEGLTRMLEAISEVRESANNALALEGILLTMFDPMLALSHEVVSEVRNYFGEKVYRTVIPRDVALSEAASYAQPVFDYSPRAPGAVAYLMLAKEVTANG
jgi:chromosome partitioning protein